MPVTVLVIEPIWKSVSGVTASGFSTDVTPMPAVVLLAVVDQADRRARRGGLLDGRLDRGVDVLEQRHGRTLATGHRTSDPAAGGRL